MSVDSPIVLGRFIGEDLVELANRVERDFACRHCERFDVWLYLVKDVNVVVLAMT
jgi:hypothetical protein